MSVPVQMGFENHSSCFSVCDLKVQDTQICFRGQLCNVLRIETGFAVDHSLSLLAYFEVCCIHVSTPSERNNVHCLYT